MRYTTDTVFAGANSAGNLTSAAIDCTAMFGASFQAVFTDGTSAGTLKVQVSNDISNPSAWSDFPSGSVAVTAGGTVFLPIKDLCAAFMRLVWTRTAGAGTVTSKLKSVGY